MDNEEQQKAAIEEQRKAAIERLNKRIEALQTPSEDLKAPEEVSEQLRLFRPIDDEAMKSRAEAAARVKEELARMAEEEKPRDMPRPRIDAPVKS